MRSLSWASCSLRLAVVALTCLNVPSVSAQSSGDLKPELRDYYSANGLLNRGLYELAAAEYRKFLSEHGRHEKAPVARYGLGVSLFRLEKYEESVSELQPLRRRKSFVYGAEVGTITGQCLLSLKRYDEAAEAFGIALSRYGDHELADDAAAGLAEALYLDAKYDKAVAHCKTSVSRWGESPLRERIEFFWGLALVAKKDNAAAADRLGKMLRRFPDGALTDRASFLMAQCYHHGDALDGASAQYRKIIDGSSSPYIPQALHGLALLLQTQDKAQEAGKVLDRLLRDHPDSDLFASATLQRGRVWFDLGKFDRAIDTFKKIGRDSPDLRDDAAYWLAKCLLRQGANVEAAKRFRLAAQKYPDSELLPEMLYDRGVALVRSEDRQAASQPYGVLTQL